MQADKIVAEFKTWGLMNNSLDNVGRYVREGRISQNCYDCYSFLWRVAVYRFSVHYPVVYNAADVVVFRQVAALLGVALRLDNPRDLVLVDDDGVRVDETTESESA